MAVRPQWQSGRNCNPAAAATLSANGHEGERKMVIDLRDFLRNVEQILATHRLDRPGAYRRWNWDTRESQGPRRELDINPYGCADAANILYTIGRFPGDPVERDSWIAVLRAMQDPGSGMFEESTHHEFHTTAHCIAALELFDARPRHPLQGMAALKDAASLRRFLDGLNWHGDPWRESHRGAGLFAALVITGEVDLSWQDAYFDWLWNSADPQTGLFGGAGLPPVAHSGSVSMVPHMAGTFHYLFNMEWARRKLRYPDRLIDSCLDMLADGRFPLGARVGFAEIDWFFCVNRSLRQCGHRFADCRSAMTLLGQRLADYVLSLDPAADDGLNDLHSLFGLLCAFAELQQAVPELVRSDRPLKLVLDRRPFI